MVPGLMTDIDAEKMMMRELLRMQGPRGRMNKEVGVGEKD